MLKEILSLSGKPGLYKLVAQGKNMLIVESIPDGKRIPAYSKDKAVSLGDIAVFTEDEEISLSAVFEKIKAHENGAVASIDPKSDNNQLRTYFSGILPDYDKDRVYPSDMRKMISWYNLLISSGLNDFSLEKQETEETKEVEE